MLEETTKEEVINDQFCMTVGTMLDYIEKYNIPREAKVVVERVHDSYFESGGWKVLKKIHGDINDPKSHYEEYEYIEAWSPHIRLEDKDQIFYIDCHY